MHLSQREQVTIDSPRRQMTDGEHRLILDGANVGGTPEQDSELKKIL